MRQERSYRTAVRVLKGKWPAQFRDLSESTVKSWFPKGSFTKLTAKVSAAIDDDQQSLLVRRKQDTARNPWGADM